MRTRILALLLLLSTSVFANDDSTMCCYYSKEGSTVYVGVSAVTGNLSDISMNTVLNLGYDYTFSQGAILGIYYTPKLISHSAHLTDTSATGAATIAMNSRVLGIYAGYEFDNYVRLTGGLTFTNTEISAMMINTSSTLSGSHNETNVGINAGIGYLYHNFLIESRLSTHDVGGVKGSTFNFNAGYKF